MVKNDPRKMAHWIIAEVKTLLEKHGVICQVAGSF